MSKLPRISGRACVKALEKAGFYFKRQEGTISSCGGTAHLSKSSFLTIRNWIEVLYVQLSGRLV